LRVSGRSGKLRRMSAPELEAMLSAFERSLECEDSVAARHCLAALQDAAGVDHAEVMYAEARLLWLEHGPHAARALLERVVTAEARHADAHYDLACFAEHVGDRAAMVQRFLRVRALDAEADKQIGIGGLEHFDHIERVAREVLDGLPAMFTQRLSHVPVLIERRPNRALVEDGFDPRAFGLFEGPTESMRDAPSPTRIVLFACNLLAAFPTDPELSEQIEVTLLHEIGHFFGLDEDQLTELGLD
jgi:predicted Zn-dependent protease with MMP-like domain